MTSHQLHRNKSSASSNTSSKTSLHALSTSKRSPSRSPGLVAARRMPNEDVRAIFESLHQHAPFPAHLKFKVVLGVMNGKKLSPPPFEYEDGLYVLLKPPKKTKNKVDPVRVPPHLVHLVMPVPAETCPWQLSGPQFPQKTAIQQRYCYPRGPAEYSDRKGGSLWTMYNTDGKENEDFRLLHVYFSHKRAVNKGVVIPEAELAAAAAAAAHPLLRSPARTPSRSPSKGRNAKKRQAAHQLTSPPRRQSLHHRQHPHVHVHSHPEQSPAITTSPSICSSRLSFDTLMPTSPVRGFTTATGASSLPPDLFFLNFHPTDAALLTPSPFRRGKLLSNYNNSSGSYHSIQQSPVETTRDVEEDDSKEPMYPFFASDMDASLQEIDSYWDDPMLTMLDPSLDVHSVADATDTHTLFTNDSTKTSVLRSLAQSLDGVHRTIRESIFSADHAEQPALVSLVATWARRVAKDPLKSAAAPPEILWQPALRRSNQIDQHHWSGVAGKDHGHGYAVVDVNASANASANDDSRIDAGTGQIAAVQESKGPTPKSGGGGKNNHDDDDTVDARNGQTAAV